MSPPSYEEIASDLRERIRGGDYPPGSRLPVRPELAAHYDVVVGTIQVALTALAREGLIKTTPGSRKGALVLRAPGPPPLTIDELTAEVRELRERLDAHERGHD